MLGLILLVLVTAVAAHAQRKSVFTTKFIPRVITYNASPNPAQCWEAVAHGIGIKAEKGEYFFQMPWKALQDLKIKLGETEVQIEVQFFEEADDDTGAAGFVRRVSLGDSVMYKSDLQEY